MSFFKKINLFSKTKLDWCRGQALIEILIGLFVAGILISAATAAVVVTLRSNLESKNFQAASSLNQELIDDVKVVAEADWHNIYGSVPIIIRDKGPNTQYYVAASGTALIILPGTTSTTIGNIVYTKFFSIENTSRLNGDISTSPSAIDDPSTQKIVSHVQWRSGGRTSEVVSTVYLTRWRNIVSRQTDWAGGAGQEGPLNEFSQRFTTSTGIYYSSSSFICVQGIPCE